MESSKLQAPSSRKAPITNFQKYDLLVSSGRASVLECGGALPLSAPLAFRRRRSSAALQDASAPFSTIEAWSLGFIWSLEPGAWSFFRCH